MMDTEIAHNALLRAIEIAGSQQAFADRMSAAGNKVTQQAVSLWLNSRKGVPAERVVAAELATEGQVKRSEFRPELYKEET